MKRGDQIFIKINEEVVAAQWIGNDPNNREKCYVKIGYEYESGGIYYDEIEEIKSPKIISIEKSSVIIE